MRPNTVISWQSSDGFAFLRFSGMGLDAALDLAEHLELRSGDVAGLDPESLPVGWVSESDEPVTYTRNVRGVWGAGMDGERGFDFTAASGLWGDFAVHLGVVHTVDVMDSTGILTKHDSRLTLTWYVDGVIAELQSVGVTEAELMAVARSVEPITERRRQQMAAPVTVTAATATTSAGTGAPDNRGPRIDVGRLEDLPVGSIRVRSGLAVARTSESTLVGLSLVDHGSPQPCVFTPLVAEGVVTAPGKPVFKADCASATFALDGSCIKGCVASMPLVPVEDSDGALSVKPGGALTVIPAGDDDRAGSSDGATR